MLFQMQVVRYRIARLALINNVDFYSKKRT